jgi:hypothetical protein
MKTIKKPNKITVASNNRTSSTGRFDLVIAMLEHEHSLLLLQQRHRNYFLDVGASDPVETKGTTAWVCVALVTTRSAKVSKPSSDWTSEACTIGVLRKVVSPPEPGAVRVMSLRSIICATNRSRMSN